MSSFGWRWPNVEQILAPRSNNLTALRLAAAVCVVVSHCFLLKIGVQEAEPLSGSMVYSLGDHALHAFFYISGLTIAASLARAGSMTEFAVARGLRIWPALMVVTAVLALVVGPTMGRLPAAAYFADPGWKEYLANGLFLSAAGLDLPGMFVDAPHLPVVDGSPWTLKYEVICYGLLALGALAAGGRSKLKSAVWAPAATLTAAITMVLLPPGNVETHLDHIARLWFAFGLGVMTWQFADRLRPSLLLLAGIGFDLWLSLGTPLERPFSIIFVAALVLTLAAIPTGALRRFTNRTDLSYGVYITAWPITQTLVERFPAMPLWAIVIATLCFATGVATLSWSLVEKPAMALRPFTTRLIERVAHPFAIAFRRMHLLGAPRFTTSGPQPSFNA